MHRLAPKSKPKGGAFMHSSVRFASCWPLCWPAVPMPTCEKVYLLRDPGCRCGGYQPLRGYLRLRTWSDASTYALPTRPSAMPSTSGRYGLSGLAGLEQHQQPALSRGRAHRQCASTSYVRRRARFGVAATTRATWWMAWWPVQFRQRRDHPTRRRRLERDRFARIPAGLIGSTRRR